jgi:polysaccharide export outer membrane protein
MKTGSNRICAWKRWAVAFVWLGTLPVAGQTPIGSESSPENKAPTQFADRDPRYRLELGDEIEIEFRFTPEFNQKLTIQPDGFLSLQDVGDLKAVGMTLAEVRTAIREKYAGVLNEPAITIKLLVFNKPYFVVGGEVTKPGKYDLQGHLTLLDAIAVAGGFGAGAHSSEVLLFRRMSQEMVEVKRVNVQMVMNGDPGEDVTLRPGDSVFVPRSKLGKLDRFMSMAHLGMYFPIPIP